MRQIGFSCIVFFLVAQSNTLVVKFSGGRGSPILYLHYAMKSNATLKNDPHLVSVNFMR